MSTRDELVARFKTFLDKNYPCCGVPGCSGEEEEAKALVDMAYEVMRPLTLVEIAARDRPEQMEAARAQVRAERKAAMAERIRAAREAAWDEGDEHGAAFPHRKRGFKYDDNPYRKQEDQ